MKIRVLKRKHVVALAAALVTLATSANAQTPVAENARARLASAAQKIQAACGPDVRKFCRTVTPGEGRLIFCMKAHEDKISNKCDYALYSALRNMASALNLIEQAADVCWPDIEKYCADTPKGGGRVAQCLLNKKSTLAKDCQLALEQFPGQSK